ncbi:MAG: glycosyltransferase 36, partial [Asticcacaulis sp.]
LSFFAADQTPGAYETRREDFEGEGGLRDPDMLRNGLQNTHAHYETPAAIMQFDVDLKAGESHVWHFVFGPAFDEAEIAAHIDAYLGKANFDKALKAAKTYIEAGRGVLNITTPDAHFDAFVNGWLSRQVYYHGDTNRLTTDPQIRNYLQDAMGMVYIRPEAARAALLRTFSQQNADGSMPDGVTLYEGAELKYINQVPHSDHCVWLPILLEAYLDETGDYGLLDEDVAGQSIRTRMQAAMQWLIKSRDHRGLSFIDQGDWCDPMNMVGYKGKGVSGWLTLASAYALQVWAKLSGENAPWLSEAEAFNAAANTHMWDGDWYGRGITDEGVLFGVKADDEGRIYVNPQSFAMLSGAASADQIDRMIHAVEDQLETPYGVEMLGKPYTKMRDDVGRLTQKSPGSAENGAVYNHAGAFYIYSLYQAGMADKGFDLLNRMLTGPDEADYLQRGQLPLFIPNYYRGDHKANPRTAGRSSQLFNTGTISWVYRIVIEGLFGVKGCQDGLMIAPNLPGHWDQAHVKRTFRGAEFDIDIRRDADVTETVLEVDGLKISGTTITGIEAGRTYAVRVLLPA